MGFSNLDKPEGLATLNSFLEDKSYIEGYTPSAADLSVFEAVTAAPTKDTPHALRWYSHIKAIKSSAKFPGDKKDASSYGPSVVISSAPAAADNEEDLDLFGSDDEEEDAEAEKIKQERLAAYNAKKAAKPKAAAKSMVTLDVKPWDDETDMEALKQSVRGIAMDGLVWGGDKFLPIGYGIRKLQISCVIEDDKVGVDDLSDQITAFEDFVQSVDIASFNKL